MLRYLAVFAAVGIAAPATSSFAQDDPTLTQPRQETRENRQEARQGARGDRREQRQERAHQRLDNRTPYYSNQAWGALDTWFTRNNITPLPDVSRAVDAAVNVTEKAVNAATNAAEKVANSTASATARAPYGYTNPNGAGKDGWFYDYYTYSPTYYNAPSTGSKIYGSATRYYDLNNDGVYDSLNVFRDSDNNASYDVYDRYDFGDLADQVTEPAQPAANAEKRRTAEQLADSPEDANRHTFVGKIYASKSAKVNGTENIIARLSNADPKDSSTNVNEGSMLVDLGPKQGWSQRTFKAGDTLTATGPLERVGDKSILVAETATLNDQKEFQIVRGSPKMEGQVVDVTQTEVKGVQHTLAVIESESKRQLVDLGPTDKLKLKIEPQTKIIVQGVPVRVRNHSVVQAASITIDGQQIVIQRGW